VIFKLLFPPPRVIPIKYLDFFFTQGAVVNTDFVNDMCFFASSLKDWNFSISSQRIFNYSSLLKNEGKGNFHVLDRGDEMWYKEKKEGGRDEMG